MTIWMSSNTAKKTDNYALLNKKSSAYLHRSSNCKIYEDLSQEAVSGDLSSPAIVTISSSNMETSNGRTTAVNNPYPADVKPSLAATSLMLGGVDGNTAPHIYFTTNPGAPPTFVPISSVSPSLVLAAASRASGGGGASGLGSGGTCSLNQLQPGASMDAGAPNFLHLSSGHLLATPSAWSPLHFTGGGTACGGSAGGTGLSGGYFPVSSSEHGSGASATSHSSTSVAAPSAAGAFLIPIANMTSASSHQSGLLFTPNTEGGGLQHQQGTGVSHEKMSHLQTGSSPYLGPQTTPPNLGPTLLTTSSARMSKSHQQMDNLLAPPPEKRGRMSVDTTVGSTSHSQGAPSLDSPNQIMATTSSSASEGNPPTSSATGSNTNNKREFRLSKNREAARECRRKKKEYVRCLEARVHTLESQNQLLIEELGKCKTKIQMLQEENAQLTLRASCGALLHHAQQANSCSPPLLQSEENSMLTVSQSTPPPPSQTNLGLDTGPGNGSSSRSSNNRDHGGTNYLLLSSAHASNTAWRSAMTLVSSAANTNPTAAVALTNHSVQDTSLPPY